MPPPHAQRQELTSDYGPDHWQAGRAGTSAPDLLVTVRLLETDPDLMLGVQDDAGRQDHELELADGDTLLLYTDGLVERRSSTLQAGLHCSPRSWVT